MPLNVASPPHMTDRVLVEDDKLVEVKVTDSNTNVSEEPFETSLVWPNIIFFGYLHIGMFYGTYLLFATAMIKTFVWGLTLGIASGLGITAGAHRLWSHRAYKANIPLRVFLMICNCLAHQNSVIEWARDHRVHRAFSETDADQHNRKRGFWFAHVGWLLTRKRPEVIKAAREVDITDLQSDPILYFQDKYYFLFMPLVGFVIPSVIPVYFWGETWTSAWYTATVTRYVISLNVTWCINSAAHTWGNRPYDKGIFARENPVLAFLTLGEGWHNYHHVFPWDYKGSELGNYRLDFTTMFLDYMAKIGWASDFKTVPAIVVKSRAENTGDGTHPVWGWGDKNMSEEDKGMAIILHKKSL